MSPESLNDIKHNSIELKGPTLKEIPPPRPKGRKRTGWVWLVVTVLLVAGVYLFWYRGGSPHDTQAANKVSSDQKSNSAVVPVVATKTKRGDIGVYLTSLGAVT